MIVQSYLFFNGRCEEAIAFYKSALGAEVDMLMRFREAPEAPPPGMVAENWGDKIMHSSFRIGDTTVLASDGCNSNDEGFKGFSLVVNVASETEARKAFDALAEGGQVQMPLGKTFFSPCYGMLVDRFGIGWMVITMP